MHLRVNVAGGGSQWVEMPLRSWQSHPDDGVDLVACQAGFDSHVWDARSFPMTSAATRAVIEQEKIGLGDDVFLTGLFEKHYGKNRNIPIIRTGAIAAMPEEPVPWTRRSIDDDRSVAMRVSRRSSLDWRTKRVTCLRPHRQRSRLYLLGVMHGHWDAPLDEPVQATAVSDEMRLERVNMGIGIVTPADELIELLDHPGLSTPVPRVTSKQLRLISRRPDRG